MIIAKDLKRIINAIPDNVAVTIGGNYDCNIESFTYETMTGIADLHLSENYEIIKTDFLDAIFQQSKTYTTKA